MKATLKLEDGREIQVELSKKDADAIIKPKKTGWERAEVGEYYRYIYISTGAEAGTRADDDRYQKGQYISSYDLAFDQIRAIKLWLRIKRWAAEHCESVDWEGRSDKYSFYWDYVAKRVCVSGVSIVCRTAFTVYFDTVDHAEQCVEEFRDDLIWYFTECKDRMDG